MGFKKYGLLGLFILFLGLISIGIILLSPQINLLGETIVNVDVFSEYKEDGYQAMAFFKDVSREVIVDNKVDTSKVGKYSVTYKLNYYGFKIIKKRTVNVVDKEAPIITLTGNTEVIVCPSKEYVEEGFEVADNYDTDLKDKVKIKNDNGIITYSVSDSSGNASTVERKLKKEIWTLLLLI